MWPFPNPLDLFGDAASAVTGWAWDKVIQGIYTWFANGLLLLMEWVWGILDSATTPSLSEDWFRSDLVEPIAALAVSVTVAMMLASAIQAGFGGRPELIVDALKEGPKAIAATAVTLVVVDKLIEGADVLSAVVWQTGRGDAQTVLDGLAATMAATGPLSTTFLGPFALFFGMIGLLVTAVVLFMRSSLLYVVAAFSPIVWASSISPVMRGSARRLVHITVALVLAKPAITVTLVVGLKLLANTTTASSGAEVGGAEALGRLISGFTCFAIAGLSPWVLYRLLPSVEQASVSSGIVGGWGRSAMGMAQAGMLAKSMGASSAASAANRPIPIRTSSSSYNAAPSSSAPATSRAANAATGGVPSGSRRPATRTRQIDPPVSDRREPQPQRSEP